MYINVFHGYTHCYVCQLQFHPNIINGIDLEDLETLERVFSSSNHLTSIIHYASPYHCRLFIEAYFKQWDEDKALNSGTFILNNIVQATQILDCDTVILEDVKTSLGITDKDMNNYQHEQALFFSKLGDKEPYNVHKVTYVKLLQKLCNAENERDRIAVCFLGFSQETGTQAYNNVATAIKNIEFERRQAAEEHVYNTHEVCDLEIKLSISRSERWTLAHPKYIAAMKFLQERKYRHTLEKLQWLII